MFVRARVFSLLSCVFWFSCCVSIKNQNDQKWSQVVSFRQEHNIRIYWQVVIKLLLATNIKKITFLIHIFPAFRYGREIKTKLPYLAVLL